LIDEIHNLCMRRTMSIFGFGDEGLGERVHREFVLLKVRQKKEKKKSILIKIFDIKKND